MLSRTIAKYSRLCAVVHEANRFLPFSLSTKLTVRRPCSSEPTFALASSPPPNSSHGCVGAPEAGHLTFGSTVSGEPSVGGVMDVGIGTNWSWPVWPTRSRIALVSLMPGTSTTIRFVPDVTTTGSETPVAFTRRSMIPLTTLTSASVGWRLPFGSTRYSTFSPP